MHEPLSSPDAESPGSDGREIAILKAHDSPVAVLLAGPAAYGLLPLARALRVSPNQVTLFSLVVTLLAAALIVFPARPAFRSVAAALIIAGFVLDCLDGQLARATDRRSHFGAYLDAMTDLFKVFALLAACGWVAGGSGPELAAWSFFWFALCQHHVHVTHAFPQRSQLDYETVAAPWKRRLAVGEQRIDVAFAIGEVLLVLSLAVLSGWLIAGLVLLGALLPIQFISYTVRFWKHRYAP